MKQVRDNIDQQHLILFHLACGLRVVIEADGLIILVGSGHGNLELEHASLDRLDDLLCHAIVLDEK